MKNEGLKWVRGYPFWISTALVAVMSFLYYQVLLGLAGRTDGAMIRVSVPIARDGSIEHALDIAVNYIHQVSPFLYEYLPGSHAL